MGALVSVALGDADGTGVETRGADAVADADGVPSALPLLLEHALEETPPDLVGAAVALRRADAEALAHGVGLRDAVALAEGEALLDSVAAAERVPCDAVALLEGAGERDARDDCDALAVADGERDAERVAEGERLRRALTVGERDPEPLPVSELLLERATGTVTVAVAGLEADALDETVAEGVRAGAMVVVRVAGAVALPTAEPVAVGDSDRELLGLGVAEREPVGERVALDDALSESEGELPADALPQPDAEGDGDGRTDAEGARVPERDPLGLCDGEAETVGERLLLEQPLGEGLPRGGLADALLHGDAEAQGDAAPEAEGEREEERAALGEPLADGRPDATVGVPQGLAVSVRGERLALRVPPSEAVAGAEAVAVAHADAVGVSSAESEGDRDALVDRDGDAVTE